ncbi:putative DUF4185 domain-containing protein [Seiridium unicorne]|uniref:DUF4185 domain-containing protein n=1 Tax=Seiridium unicorne TaxID=138068 RepID=A0ABR2VHP2_9PEZI
MGSMEGFRDSLSECTPDDPLKVHDLVSWSGITISATKYLFTSDQMETMFIFKTASVPEGPWMPDAKVFTATPIAGGLTYASIVHPYHDATGKTLVISYTNNNHIKVLQ